MPGVDGAHTQVTHKRVGENMDRPDSNIKVCEYTLPDAFKPVLKYIEYLEEIKLEYRALTNRIDGD